MNASENCFAVIRAFESCPLTSYPDKKTGGAPWTCGWGATGPEIGPGVVWTQDRADRRLLGDVAQREIVASHAITVLVTQGQFDAFVSLLYNVGEGNPKRDGIIRLKSGAPSTLLRLLNAGDADGCADEFLRWVSPGSNVTNGLLRRRTVEQAVFRGVSAADALDIAFQI